METIKRLPSSSQERLATLTIKKLGTIENYLVSSGILTEQQMNEVSKNVRKMATIPTEMIAYRLGYISDTSLIKIIREYRMIGIVEKSELMTLTPSFGSFSKEICQKYAFFEYKMENLTSFLICPYGLGETENMVKRRLERYSIRYSLDTHIIDRIIKMEELI